MNEKDIEYLRNINTSPGPNAGKSIDPTRPGRDDLELPIRSTVPLAGPAIDAQYESSHSQEEEHRRQVAEGLRSPGPDADVTRSSGNVFADLGLPDADKLLDEAKAQAQSDTRLRCLITGNPCGTDTWEKNSSCKCANCQTWLAQSDAEPVAWRPNADVRAETAAYRIKAECFDWDGSFSAERAYHIIRAALARSDAEPDYERAWNQAQDRIAKLEAALAQSDAEPWRCPIGIPPESHNICSAGTCWWCLADRVKAQSNAELGILHNKEAGFKDVVTRDTAAIYDNDPQPRLVEEIHDFDRELIGFRVYDATPRPDASAGLIEALEALVIDCENKWGDPHTLAEARAALTTTRARAARAALAQSDAEPVAWREALEQQLFALVELARDTRSDKGGEAQWIHPVSALIREFTKRIAAPPRPDAEPVAWQYRWKPTKTTGWTEWHGIPKEELGKYPNPIYETRALYATPPRPDASAGLIEIEEAFLWLAEEPIDGTQKEKDAHLDKMPLHFNETMRKVRARAADRSGK
jgi:hypothetical protein